MNKHNWAEGRIELQGGLKGDLSQSYEELFNWDPCDSAWWSYAPEWERDEKYNFYSLTSVSVLSISSYVGVSMG